MAINKLPEFAKDGQKNTDDLVLTDGFPVLKKPARQWFNYLFNMLSLKINELIELDQIARSEIVDNLTTNDANKVASARTVKELQDNKLANTDLKDATTEQKGIVRIVNDLTTGGAGEVLTAEMGKVLNDQAFGIGQTWQVLTASRAINTTYTNTTGRPIEVMISVSAVENLDSHTIFIDGLDVSGLMEWGLSYMRPIVTFTVPAGSTYKYQALAGALVKWSELR